MTTLTDTQVITASGGLVELGYLQVTSGATITAASEGASNAVTSSLSFVSDGSPVAVDFFCPSVTTPQTAYLVASLYVDGVFWSRIGLWYTNSSSLENQPAQAQVRLSLAAGSHTVQVRGWKTGGSSSFNFDVIGSGTGGPGFLRVSKIVQATQWPAVTTGTIICTSSTRPASPFQGQTIYETDTGLSKIYNGTAWVSPQYQSKPPALSYYWSNVSTTGFSQFVVSGAPTTTQYDSGDISYNSSTGVFTLPKNGLYMASFHASPVSGSGFFPVTISVDPASGATQTTPYIGNSYSGAGWASYTTMNASGIFAANGDRQIRFRIYTSATSGFEAFVRLAWISST